MASNGMVRRGGVGRALAWRGTVWRGLVGLGQEWQGKAWHGLFMSGKASQQKGRRGEREAAELLRPIFSQVRTKRSGGESAIQDRGRDLLGTPGISCQVKSMDRIDCLKALSEATAAALPDEIPLALVRRTRTKGQSSSGWVAVLPAQQFIGLWSLAREAMLRMKADLHAGQPAGNLADQPEPYDPGTDRQH